MAMPKPRFNRPGSDKVPGPWGTITGTLVRDGEAYVTTTIGGDRPIVVLTSAEAMVTAAFLGRGSEAYRSRDKVATVAAMIRAGSTPPPTPTPDPDRPVPAPTPEPTPVPTPPTPPTGATTIAVTTDGVPGYMTPAEIVAAGGGTTGEPQYVRVTVTIPARDDMELPDLHHPLLPDILRVIAAAETAPHLRNVWLAGPAGTGKSTIPMQAAQALGLECRSISCGPDDSTAKWFGYQDANGNYHGTAFRAAYEGGGVFIIDEIDASDPGILTALNQALAAEWYEFPDGKVDRHPSLRVIATANTWGNGATREYVGRQEIDAATLDRFGTAWFVGYDAEIDRRTVMQYATTDALRDTLDRWLRYCLAIRERAQANRIKVIVSPRRMGAGAGMIAAGFTPQDALRRTFFTEGLSEDVIATLTPDGITL